MVSRHGTLSHFKPDPEPVREQLRVAVFEDFGLVFRIYQKTLHGHGFDVVTPKIVESVEDAISNFAQARPDVVITDLSLTPGGAEGFEILRRIRAIDPSIPVALSTSVYSPKNHDPLAEEMRSKGFDGIFHKVDFPGILKFLESKARDLMH